jgi:ArsR family transcriptional regulator
MYRSLQLKALSSEPRLKILQLLVEPKKNFSHQYSADPEEIGVCMTLIADALEVTQPTISRHLDILKQARLITVKRHMKWSYCQRDELEIQNYLEWLKVELSI